jgi:hypothetical protein
VKKLFVSQITLFNAGLYFTCFRAVVWSVLFLTGITCIADLFGGEPADYGHSSPTTIRFSRDVLPILSDRCFHCHGPDESDRQADLRLDVRDEAIADQGGYRAIHPGLPDQSNLIERITAGDEDVLMPPPDSHRKPLSQTEIAILRDWIAEGAQWGRHWAFEPPVRPPLPQSSVPDGQPGNPIDALIQQRLTSAGLQMSPPASKPTLLRRVSFDLTGLPPTAEELDAFLQDDSPNAYEKAVDRLLQSKHHGERMAMWWLDAARYADTDGFQGDATRTNWPWRDWIVEAFNRNQPFDQFTIEQFAGDLLPHPTPEQIIATCFHRNHMTNGEGGRDPEESRVDYVIDRVNTTGTVWLGMTFGCAQCHSHKFDPISHEDYYSLFAFFNSIDEDGKAGNAAKPYLKYMSSQVEEVITEAQRWSAYCSQREAAARADAERGFTDWLTEQVSRVAMGLEPWQPVIAQTMVSAEGTVLTQGVDGSIQTSGPKPRQDDYQIVARTDLPGITALRLEVLPHDSHTESKWSRGATGTFILTNVKLQVRRLGDSQVREVEIESAVANREEPAKGRAYGNVKDTLDDDPRNGWTTSWDDGQSDHPTAVFALSQPLTLAEDEEFIFWMLHRSTDGDANIGRFRLSVSDQPGGAVRSVDPMPIERLAAVVAATNTADPSSQDKLSATDLGIGNRIDRELRQELLQQYLFTHSAYQQIRRQSDTARRWLAEVKKAAGELSVMVLAERAQPRPTHILERGVWDQPGKSVGPDLPQAILPWNDSDPPTRLDLANWIVDRQNPLTSRVVANHLWQICFGAGLVRTPDDFGLQGEQPTHPELLDWLAVELLENGWDLRRLLKHIVTSDTYRQASDVPASLLEVDPENRLLARGARFRLPSWMIRDAALQASGLLNRTVGGPPVLPYQPAGVWEEIFMGRYTYDPTPGPAQYRRTLYAFWRRSSSPTFLFDSAQRRVCEVSMNRTNTPLHALTLLNDTGMLEASAVLAWSTSKQADPTTESRLIELFRRIVSRSPSDYEMEMLHDLFNDALSHYRQSPVEATELLSIGQTDFGPMQDAAEVAAYMVVASMIFNLDEAITHE